MNSRNNKAIRTSWKAGFTLIELGMVLVVIALVVGGVIGGKALFDAAEGNLVERSIKQYSSNVDKFREMYGGLPGDLNNASSYFGCTDCDGNGDGFVRCNDANSNGTCPEVGEVDETQLFWQHLRFAKMLEGETVTVGTQTFPKGPMDNTVVNVRQDESMGIVFQLTSYQGATTGYAAMKGLDAWKLDSKYDDGNPATGVVRATDGAGASCVSGGAYVTSGTTSACVVDLAFQREGGAANDSQNLDLVVGACDTGSIGETRASTTPCPTGFKGNLIETCGRAGWRQSSRSCEPVNCGGGFYNETRTAACPAGFAGSITQLCTESEIWSTTASNCVPEGACTVGQTKSVPCGYGQAGVNILSCPAGTWVLDTSDPTKTCGVLSCANPDGGAPVNIGGTITRACPAGYEGPPGGGLVNLCTIDPTATPVVGKLILSVNKCVPRNDEACGTLNDTRTQDCPPTNVAGTNIMTGSVIQTCRTASDGALKWITTTNTCAVKTCGDKPAGYIRQSTKPCPAGKTGFQSEICDETGTWKVTDSTCASVTCAGADAPSGFHATFPSAVAGNNSTGVCDGGYMASPSVPILLCQADGTWASSLTSGGCTGSAASCFTKLSQWEATDVDANTSGSVGEARGTAVSPDGQYMYVTSVDWGHQTTPADRDSYGAIGRYDSTMGFSDPAAWTVFVPGFDGIGGFGGEKSHGYAKASSDSRYIYFMGGGDGQWYGEFLQYDTTKSFNDSTAWLAPQFSADPNDFMDYDYWRQAWFGEGKSMVHTATHLYVTYTGCRILIFDKSKAFNDATAWTAIDTKPYVVNAGGKCFNTGISHGNAVYDGVRYIYFAPDSETATRNGNVVRLDTTANPATNGAWTSFNPATAVGGLGANYQDFEGAAFDGRYIYFSPSYQSTVGALYTMRLDVGADPANDGANFSDITKWEGLYIPSVKAISGTGGLNYLFFDGSYVIYATNAFGAGQKGEILAYDVSKAFNDSTAWDYVPIGMPTKNISMGGDNIYFSWDGGQWMVKYETGASCFYGPSIQSVTVFPGKYPQGSRIRIEVEYDEIVTHDTGWPDLPYIAGDIGGTAVQFVLDESSAGTDTLVFYYDVPASRLDADGITITSPIVAGTGQIYSSSSGNFAVLTFVPPDTTGITVDSTNAPAAWVTVPATVLLDGTVVPSFQVMTYEAKNVGSVATSQAAGNPWTRTIAQAITACNALGGGARLMNDSEYVAIMTNAIMQPQNWSNGKVGLEYPIFGNQFYWSSGGSTNANNGINGFFNIPAVSGAWYYNAYAPDPDTDDDTEVIRRTQRRTWVLSNGSMIWDIMGNAKELTFCDYTTAGMCNTTTGVYGAYTAGTTYHAFTDTTGLADNTTYNTAANNLDTLLPVSRNMLKKPAAVTYPTSGVLGGLYENFRFSRNGARTILRGGAYSDSYVASPFGFDMINPSGTAQGFRCTKP